MRQNITPNYAQKVFESYTDFSSGLNSEIANEKLRDSESPILENVDISSNGSIKRRYGRTLKATFTGTKAQGVFQYRQRTGSTLVTYFVAAIDGRLYIKDTGVQAWTEVIVYEEDGTTPTTFQATRDIDAAQYGDKLYIATGSFLCELHWTGTAWSAKKVTPYQPTVMEALYIGTNALADEPNLYIQDGTPGQLNVTGIQITDPDTDNTLISGAVNKNLDLTAFITKAASGDTIEYQWEVKKSSETTWPGTPAQAFDATKKTWTYMPTEATNYDFKVTIRKQGTTTPTAVWNVTKYEVKATLDPTNKPLVTSGIQTCNKIVLHYDRLILGGDTTAPSQIYVSDLTNPAYFPTNNTANFDTGKQEDVTAIVRFQNHLIFFTTSSIQTLLGKSPQDYERNLIHDGIGCVYGRTAQVVGNQVFFLSNEGVQSLRPNPYRLENMNVDRKDYPVKTELGQANKANACAYVNNSQYWICLPEAKLIYRYNFETDAWAKDKSDKLDIVHATVLNDEVFEITKTGIMYVHDKTIYTDDNYVYDMIIESKYFDLSATFNYKKVKKLYVLSRGYTTHSVDLYVTVVADSTVVLSPEGGHVQIVNGFAEWVAETSPNMIFASGSVMGEWEVGRTPLGDIQLVVNKAGIQGKARRTKIRIRHSDQNSCEVYGYGFEFRLAKP
jgi:hypothetical protein